MELYETYPEDDNPTPFNSLATLKLLYYLLQADYRFEGCKIPIHTLLHDGTLCGFFPLHDRTIVNNLKLKALNCYTAPWSFDLNAIRNYFGEKFALFFAWVTNLEFNCLQYLIWADDFLWWHFRVYPKRVLSTMTCVLNVMLHDVRYVDSFLLYYHTLPCILLVNCFACVIATTFLRFT